MKITKVVKSRKVLRLSAGWIKERTWGSYKKRGREIERGVGKK